MTTDPPWLVVITILALGAASWLPPIRKEAAPWPILVAFYAGFFGAAIAGEGSHWLLATLALAISVAATGWLGRHWRISRRGSSGSSAPADR
ncbi:hypothetical protein [Kribbella sp. NPDC051718]|uniref:hypothetical protein n=1 Tax=Kribbella sp. NPDC051718 TaxID=3155168 RepID=UPI003414DAD3